MTPGLPDLIPGLREAEDRYREANAEAFAGVEPDICKMVAVLPFTPQMYLELSGVGNTVFADKGTEILEADVATFLWRISPYFVHDNIELQRFFTANLAVLPYGQAIEELHAYIERAWYGMPLWPGRHRGYKPLAQWPSRLVHLFASEYGWNEETILNMPFRRLWQYANRILEERDPKYRERCAASMKMRDDWLQKVNSRGGAN